MAKKDISFEEAQGYVQDGRFDDAIRYFVQQGLCPGDVREQFGGDAFLRFESYRADLEASKLTEGRIVGNEALAALDRLREVEGKVEYIAPGHFVVGVVQYAEKGGSGEGVLVSGEHRQVSEARRDTGEPDLYDLEFSFRKGEVKHFWRNRHGARIYIEDDESITDVIEREMVRLSERLERHGMQTSKDGRTGLRVKYPDES